MENLDQPPVNLDNGGPIPTRRLGKTELNVSLLGLGGGHIARTQIPAATSVRIMQKAIDHGITFLDNAWDYHDGESERRMGKALEGRRGEVVLMTKVCGRDRRTAQQNLEDSLRRLRTDTIDIWQFHEINYDNDPEWIFRSGGAIEAAVAARQAGKIRFIGFTGHKSPHILLKMLQMDFDWDTCQMPINVLDFHFRSFYHEVLAELKRRDMGIIGMKSLGGDGQLITGAGLTAEQCRRYALSMPISTLVAGITSWDDLQQDLQIARQFTPMSRDELAGLRDRVREVAADGRFEWFKTTQHYDSKTHRAQHGFAV